MSIHEFLLSTINIDQMYPIWRIEAIESSVLLYKIDETNFWVTQQGSFTPILSHPLYLVIEKQLLELLEKNAQTNLSPLPVSIYDRPTKTYIPGYYKINAEMISHEILRQTDHTDHHIWIDEGRGELYVSRFLKEKLEAAAYKGILFYPGNAFFVG